MSKNNRSLFFSGEHLGKLNQLVKDACQSNGFDTYVSKVLDFLRACRFRSVRFYECATSSAENDEVLILAAQTTSAKCVELGYAIRYRQSTLGKSIDPYAPTVGSSQDTNEKWVSELNLQTRSCWVDIPVRAHDRLIGVIAADWEADSPRLEGSDLGVLAVLGNLVASVSESVTSRDADRVESAFTDSLVQHSDDVTTLLTIAVNDLVDILGFAIVAVFERSRGGTKLTKILERVHPKVARDVPIFDETYSLGQYLTGLAWERPEVRHIVDFDMQQKIKPHNIETRSFDRHKSLLGEIKSVLYSKIESSEPRYMVRVMNCVNSPLPIVAAQRKVVDRIAKTIAGHIDDVIARQRLDQVIDVAQLSSRNMTRPKEIVAHVRKALKEEGFDDLFVVARHRDQLVGVLFSSYPDGYEKKDGPENLDWADSAVTQLARSSSKPAVVNTLSALPRPSTWPIFQWLVDSGYQVIISKAFEASTVKGFIAIPSREPFKVPRSKNRSNGSSSTLYIIDTYAAIICSSIEGFDSYVTAEGSRKFMGRIGHEVRAPALDSSQAAIKGIALAMRVLKSLPTEYSEADELQRVLEDALQVVNHKSMEINRMMDFAKMAALQEVGNVKFNFQKIQLGYLLMEVVESLKNQKELVSLDQHGNSRECVVTVNRAISAIGEIVADETYIRVVLSHLLRNAAKYSLPRVPGRPMEIRVLARPEPQMAILQVTNWGVGIDESEFESIFRQFGRGTAHDRRKAISGLGLGLYVSRLLVSAHGGTVFCLQSKPTLDDPDRTALYEGYETTFEVRLPRMARLGVKDIELGDKRHGP